ncbi:MAG TPA: DUF4129 domain-containing protein, partial [Herpetosiphonaceae bacterium]|nr:DUF4129 domain-containing protein [Herpetosiphonaceae bacterium]
VAGFLRRGLIGLLLGLTLGGVLAQTNFNAAPAAPALTLYAACLVAGGLLALALEHSSSYSSDDEQRPSVSRTLGLVGGLIGLALLLLAVFSSAGRVLLGYVLGGIIDVGAAVIGIVAGAIYALGVLLMPSIGGDLPPATPVPGTIVPSAAEQAAQLKGKLENLPAQQSPWFEILAQGLAALLLALLIWLVVRQVLRRRRRLGDRAETDEQRSSVWSWGQFGADVRNLLQGLLPARPAPDAALEGGGAPARIRRAYRRMLALGAASASPRQPQQTPAEYRAALGAAVPEGTESLATLTAAYEQARYGPAPDQNQAAAAERALEQIEARLGGGVAFNAKAQRGKERKD